MSLCLFQLTYLMSMKYKGFEVSQVLFKSSSFCKRFGLCNNHSQGQDAEWKTYITI